MKVVDLDIREPQKELVRLNKELIEKQEEYEKSKNITVAVFLNDEVRRLKRGIAWLLLNCGEYDRALRMYKAMSWKTEGITKYLGIGIVLHKTGKVSEAKKLFAKGLRRFPESIELLLAIGNMYHEMTNFEMSLKYFDRALSLMPDNKSLAFSKANALYGLGMYEDAYQLYEKLRNEHPDEPLFTIQSGYCCLQTGNPEDASNFFKVFLNTEHYASEIFNGLFCAYYDMDLKEDALKVAEEGVRRFSDDDPRVYFNLGLCYLEQGRLSDAETTAKEGLKKFPEDENLKDLLDAIEDEINNPDDDGKELMVKIAKMIAMTRILKTVRNKRRSL